MHLKRLKRIDHVSAETSRESTSSPPQTPTYVILVASPESFLRLGGRIEGDHVDASGITSPSLHPVLSLPPSSCHWCVVRVPRVPPRSRPALHAESTAVWPMLWVEGHPAIQEVRPTTEDPGQDAGMEAGIVEYVRAGLALAQGHAGAHHDAQGCALVLPLKPDEPTLLGAQVLTLGGRLCEIRGLSHVDSTASPLPGTASHGNAGVGSFVLDTAVMKAVAAAAALDLAQASQDRAGLASAPGSSTGMEAHGDDDPNSNTAARVSGLAHKRPRLEAASTAAPSASPALLVTRYTCTGADAFLTVEPDLFDAMALLHARVRRVFFARKNTRSGALAGTLMMTQPVPNCTTGPLLANSATAFSSAATDVTRPTHSHALSHPASVGTTSAAVPLYFHQNRAINHRYAVYTLEES